MVAAAIIDFVYNEWYLYQVVDRFVIGREITR